jgi:hypothetical protein
LYAQIDTLRHELAQRSSEVEFTRQELLSEKELKKKLEARVEELVAYVERAKKFQSSSSEPDLAVSMEYLKNCVYRYMATNELSERKRMSNVICTILKLTSQERKAVDDALAEAEAAVAVPDPIASLGLNNVDVSSMFSSTGWDSWLGLSSSSGAGSGAGSGSASSSSSSSVPTVTATSAGTGTGQRPPAAVYGQGRPIPHNSGGGTGSW